jgi:hypothetical protein
MQPALDRQDRAAERLPQRWRGSHQWHRPGPNGPRRRKIIDASGYRYNPNSLSGLVSCAESFAPAPAHSRSILPDLLSACGCVKCRTVT